MVPFPDSISQFNRNFLTKKKSNVKMTEKDPYDGISSEKQSEQCKNNLYGDMTTVYDNNI